MNHTMVMCWALNCVAERDKSFLITIGMAQLTELRKVFDGTRYTVRSIDEADADEIGNALSWVQRHTDFSAFSRSDIDKAVRFNGRRKQLQP